tara:strand:+ start:11196 stop:11735 length:540 start_codon:yes stop_codon:yes gene_type:complete
MTQYMKDRSLALKSDEYGEYYADYIRHVVNSDLMSQLIENQKSAMELFGSLDDSKALYRYEEGKWSVKEVLGHVIDTERIFNYRALALARGEKNPLMGFDQDLYMEKVDFDRFSMKDIQSQYSVTREFTLSLFGSFSDDELLSKGVVSGAPFTVRALGYVIAGHEMHHRSILKERYHLK